MLRSFLAAFSTAPATAVTATAPPAPATSTAPAAPRPVELPHIYLVEVMGQPDEDAAITTKYVAALTPSEADAVRDRLARCATVIAWNVDLAGPQTAADLDLLLRSRYGA